MDAKLTRIILDAEILKLSNSMHEIIERFPERLESIGKLNYVLKELEHVKRHVEQLIIIYENIT
jgi:hypothetical protein